MTALLLTLPRRSWNSAARRPWQRGDWGEIAGDRTRARYAVATIAFPDAGEPLLGLAAPSGGGLYFVRASRVRGMDRAGRRCASIGG